jgi:molybdopterin synthase catalytic subunit
VAIHVVLQEKDFDLDEAYNTLRESGGADVGAIVSFVGLVRDRNVAAGDGSEVSTLTLEHYPGMTEASIEAIAVQAKERWGLLGLYVYHRVGELLPGDQVVLVVVSAGHRAEAFAGAEFVMDYLKTDAVLWKKEQTADGSQWIQSTQGDRERAKAWQDLG